MVMGVSGSGKSSIGVRLAEKLGLPFFDADDFHSADNVQKMANGIPLSDDDRRDWLDDLAGLMGDHSKIVLACSALRKAYRDRLREARPDVTFLYLDGDMDTIWQRHAKREDHYFNGRTMLQSQFEQLEVPQATEAIRIDIRQSPDKVLASCIKALEIASPT